jgi:hypothetical protein
MGMHWSQPRKALQQLRQRFMHDDGNVALLVALSMVAFCGFSALVADAGVLYVKKQQAQASADAGALAGADQLLQDATQAATSAYQISVQNDGHANFEADANKDNQTVTVSGQEHVGLWFARVLGQNSASISVQSAAQVGTLKSAVGVVPIAVVQQQFLYGKEYYLSQGAGNGSSGNYGFLDFSGNGAKGDETDIENGFPFPLTVGEQVPTKPGVMAGPISTAIQYRMDKACSDSRCQSYDTATPDCPRVMYLPVVDTLDVNGKKNVTIVGFAAFFLDGMVDDGGHSQITGKFIRMVRPGDLGDGPNFGTYAVKLTH